MVETDSLNRVAVANILDKDGWPDGLSDKANKAIWLVEDMERLDSIRAGVGLQPIEEYLEIVRESVGTLSAFLPGFPVFPCAVRDF